MVVYRANAVLRNKAGREVASRYPLWSGDVPLLSQAVEASRAALVPHVQDERVDTAVVHITGPSGQKTTFTEYAEDIRAGASVSADAQTTLLDDAPAMAPGELERRLDDLKQQAVAAMPGLDVPEKATKGAGGTMNVDSGTVDGYLVPGRGVFVLDEESLSWTTGTTRRSRRGNSPSRLPASRIRWSTTW